MATPSIEGTYWLVRRELPDGGVVEYPEIRGTFSYSGEYRHFSIVWRDEAGMLQSRCYVARYTLTDKKYTETTEYLIDGDEQTSTTRHEIARMSASSPVTLDGDRIAFDLPQSFEKVLSIRMEFEGDRITTTAADLFVDQWERVP